VECYSASFSPAKQNDKNNKTFWEETPLPSSFKQVLGEHSVFLPHKSPHFHNTWIFLKFFPFGDEASLSVKSVLSAPTLVTHHFPCPEYFFSKDTQEPPTPHDPVEPTSFSQKPVPLPCLLAVVDLPRSSFYHGVFIHKTQMSWGNLPCHVLLISPRYKEGQPNTQ
jgi:hypothetical protein